MGGKVYMQDRNDRSSGMRESTAEAPEVYGSGVSSVQLNASQHELELVDPALKALVLLDERLVLALEIGRAHV